MSTEKSTGKIQQVDQDSPEAPYQERNQKSTVKSTKKSAMILLKPPIKSNYEVHGIVTEADFERGLPIQAASMSQCHNRRQEIFYRACGCTPRRLKRAQACSNLVCITILEKLT
jgi:hypothetical protein